MNSSNLHKGSLCGTLKKASIENNLTYKNRQKEQDLLLSVYLLLKLSFFLLAAVSLIKIGHISKIRSTRLSEIKNSYFYEKIKFKKLATRFDDLFSVNGEQRFMKDQHQMISRDILRVIWR